MRKELAIAVLAVGLLAVSVFAQDGAPPKIKNLVLIGRGFAVSAGDPNTFKLVRMGVAEVNVMVEGNVTPLLRGVLNSEGDRLKIRDITYTESSVSGNLYRNDTQVGSISLQSVVKNEHTVWYGTMTLDGQNYNVYVLSHHRGPKPDELREKVADYCRQNRGDPNCRDRMHEFCESNPNDARCKQIFRAQCLNQTNDERCRNEFKELCTQNPDSADCERFQQKSSTRYCESHSDDRRCQEIRQKAQARGVREGE